MNNLFQTVCWINHGICADAGDFFEMLGPVLIFGIYIIASIAKTIGRKGKTDDKGKENESALKKAVRKRYQEIYQKQTGKTVPQRPDQTQPSQSIQRASVLKVDTGGAQRESEWQRRQEEIRQRNAGIQKRQRFAVQQQLRKQVQRIAKPVSPPKIDRSMRSLSALPDPALKKGGLKAVQKTSRKQPGVSGTVLSNILSHPGNLKAAFIMKEILDKPVALRDEF